ncbi:MAG: hypothetical protein CMN03_07305 [Roseibacillus sp.]|nr:hypothetical protein [Roseibacillus sp.]
MECSHQTVMSHIHRISSAFAAAVVSCTLFQPVGAKPAGDREVYKEVIVPILRGKCYQCHADVADNPSGKKKIKAKLELTSLDLVKKGGDEGPAAVAGNLDESLLLVRIKLPHDDDEHMPPEGKPQVTEEELKVLEWWIKANLPAGKSMKDAGAPDDILAAAGKIPTDEEVKKSLAQSFAEADASAAKLAAARKALEAPIAEVSGHFPNAIGFVSQQDSDLTFTAVSMRKDFNDEHLAKLAPVSGGLVDVNLGATAVTDAGAVNLGKMARLKKLWLNGTAITDAGLESLKGLSELEYLNLYGTQVTDEGLKKLAGLKNLKRLYLWQTKVTPGAVEEFKKSVKDCDVNMGIKVE